jgi:hypothetical protein
MTTKPGTSPGVREATGVHTRAGSAGHGRYRNCEQCETGVR